MASKKLKVSNILFIVALLIYIANIIGILAYVVLNSFSRDWFTSLFPKIFTTEWYKYAAVQHNITNLLFVTFIVVFAVLAISLIIAIPTSYVLARNDFPFKNILMTLLLLPMLLPPVTYGIPLATLLYRVRLAESITGVIIANLVPIVPFMILILTPFIEQIGTNIESAARMLGANKFVIFVKVISPLIVPGILTSIILAAVKIISMFELTFFVAGAKSQTIIVALFSDAYAAGVVPQQAVDALAVIYFLITGLLLSIALRFVSPTQMVFKIK
jgi:putative spermidine/putrescine transport system permease protein